MRVAFLADVHGNTVALDAVLDDVERVGVDEVWVVGDLVAIGPDPLGVLERLDGARCVRGNTDRFVATGDRPWPTVDDALGDPSLVHLAVEVSNSFAWTQGALASAGMLDRLDRLPPSEEMTLPDGSRVLIVHAAPGTDDGPGLTPYTRDFPSGGADLVVVGHTHWPVDAWFEGHRAVNVGSVSNPWAWDVRASWMLLDADADGYRLEFRRVGYDVDAALATLERSRHPSRTWIGGFLRGQHLPPWSEDREAPPQPGAVPAHG